MAIFPVVVIMSAVHVLIMTVVIVIRMMGLLFLLWFLCLMRHFDDDEQHQPWHSWQVLPQLCHSNYRSAQGAVGQGVHRV